VMAQINIDHPIPNFRKSACCVATEHQAFLIINILLF
jgi:hypothetical protein